MQLSLITAILTALTISANASANQIAHLMNIEISWLQPEVWATPVGPNDLYIFQGKDFQGGQHSWTGIFATCVNVPDSFVGALSSIVVGEKLYCVGRLDRDCEGNWAPFEGGAYATLPDGFSNRIKSFRCD